ncbi:MAG: hypothetical protein JKY67_11295 [Pseudomonadales bacterium]|nr:hypothetical protein [Pseudomonadales bacterium]
MMNSKAEDQAVRTYQLKAIAHGAMVVLVGMFAGVMLTFSVLGEISFWPLFSMTVDVPGDTSLWRGAHTGPIMNGLMCIILAGTLGLVNADPQSAKRVCISLILMVWGNTIFYIARMWGTDNRGLALHTEKYGDGNIFDLIALVPAFVVVGFGIYAVVTVIKLAFKAAKRA